MSDRSIIFEKATFHYKQQQFEEAVRLSNKLIELNPASIEAYNLLGLIAEKRKDYNSSVNYFRTAVKISGNNYVILNNLGNNLYYAGKLDEAYKVLSKVTSLNNKYHLAYFNLGKVCKAKNEYEAAIGHFEKGLEIKPDYLPAINNLANLYYRQNEKEKAEQLYLKGVLLYPDNFQLLTNVGNLYLNQEKYKEALEYFNKAIKISPPYEPAYSGLLQAYRGLNDFSQAERELDQLLNQQPENANLLFLKGNVIKSKGRIPEAIHFYKTALSYQPDHVMCLNNLGQTFISVAMHDEAEKMLLKACRLDPKCHEAHYALAKVYELKKNFEQAKQLLEDLLKEKEIAFSAQVVYDYVLLKLKIADWDNYTANQDRLIEESEKYLKNNLPFSVSPLTLNYFDVEPDLHLRIARHYAKNVKQGLDFKSFERNVSGIKSDLKGKKIKIGYLSPDLRQHAVGMLLKDLFLFHDKEQFEVHAYSIVNNDDELNLHYKSTADHFTDVSKLSHEEVALKIKKDGIDVLIDLSGYTSYTRPQVLAFRPAPVQISFLGYPDTMGADYIDYLLADDVLIDQDLEKFYTEKILKLNHAFFSSSLSTKKLAITKKEAGLPEDCFVFCCFNSYYKFTPELWDDWMEILEKTPGSILWLTTENTIAMDNLRKETLKRNIDPARLIFATRKPMEEYISAYQCADLFLDTHHYSAGSTAVCAVWGGVPIITKKGRTNASRMGASINNASGLNEFICSSSEEYINRAVYFYNNPKELKKVRKRLSLQRDQLPLFNMKEAVKNYEQVIIQAIKSS